MRGFSVALAPFSGAAGFAGANNADAASGAPLALAPTAAGGQWRVVQTLARPGKNSSASDFFGWSAAFSEDGAVLAVGAEADGGAGAVYIFDAT